MTDSYRLVTELTGFDDDGAEASWCPAGGELGPAPLAQRPSTVPGTLVLEAMAQCAGVFLQRTDTTPGSHWMLTGIDNVDVDTIAWGAKLTLGCELRKRAARAAVLTVSATAFDGEVCHATIMMHRL
jgi:3-hydroxymyristoyl/3-hydroxydecanoyl-(acyl carrier protein) dehydratase